MISNCYFSFEKIFQLSLNSKYWNLWLSENIVKCVHSVCVGWIYVHGPQICLKLSNFNIVKNWLTILYVRWKDVCFILSFCFILSTFALVPSQNDEVSNRPPCSSFNVLNDDCYISLFPPVLRFSKISEYKAK